MADINFKMGFQLDKRGLNEAKAEIAKITQQLEKENQIKIKGDDLRRVKDNVSSLDKALDKAFDKDLNKLNLKTLNAELKKSGTSLSQLQADLARSGVVGTDAFANIHREVLKTGVEAKKTKTVLDDMVDTLGKTAKWSLASGAINTLQGSVQRAVGFVKDLDESLNNIRIVTGKSSKEMEVFATQANDAAKALGKTTTEYTDASLIFFQQGKTAAEVRELTNATLIGASITGGSVTDVADQLTAVMNGYVLEANKALEVTDKLAAVGAATGSDFAELATGMSKVASAANVMGVDIDQLSGMLATVSTVTREAPETIGTTFKTIFTRMSELQAGKTDDEGWTTGKVEEAMNMIGVSVLDASGKMRDMGEVIEEIGGKWATLNRESQIGVAVAMAGQRQSSRLMALFENWEMYNDAVITSQDSMGAAMEQNTIRMDSLEYKTKQLRAESEELWSKIIDEDMLISMTEHITSVMEMINNLIDGFGGFGNAFKVLGGIATNVFSKQITDGFIKVGDKFTNLKDQFTQGIEEMKTGKPSMNQAETSAKNEIDTNVSSGAISEATGKVDSKILEDRVKLRKQEEEITKRLSAEEIKQFQGTKNEIIQEQEKLKLLVREREEISKAAEERIKDTKGFGEMYKNGASLLEIEEKMNSKKQDSLKLEKDYTKQLKVLDDLRSKSYSIQELEDLRSKAVNKETVRQLTDQEKILLKILEENAVNVEAYTDISELAKTIDEVHTSILSDLEDEQVALEEIAQTELDIQGIREQQNETESPEIKASKQKIEGLKKEGDEIEKNALRHAKVEKWVGRVGTALGVVGSMKGLGVLNDDAASAEEKVEAVNSSLMGIGSTLLSTGNPYAMVAGGVAILAGGLVKLAHEFSPVNRAIKENKKVLEEQNKVIGEAQQRVKDLMGVQSQYKDLQAAMSIGEGKYANVADLDPKNLEKYTELANEVASVAPQLVSYYDEMGNAIIDLDQDFSSLIEKEKETIRIANSAKASNAENFAIEYESIISDSEAKIAAKQKLLENIGKYGSYGGKDSSDIGAITAEINALQNKIQETQGLVKQNIIDPVFSGSEAYAGLTKHTQGYMRQLVDATRVSQKLNDPEALTQYTGAVDRFMQSLAEKNKDVAKSIEEVETRMAEIQADGVSKEELGEYNALKKKLEELKETTIPVSEAFEKLNNTNKQNAIEMSGVIQDQVDDYDMLIGKLSEYYGNADNMLKGPMQSSDLREMGGMTSGGAEMSQNAADNVADIDSKLYELADKQGELRILRDQLMTEVSSSGGMWSPEQIEQLESYREQISDISEQEGELLSARTDARYEQQEANAVMIEEAMLQAELNELYDQQIDAMLQTTEGYNQIATGINSMNASVEDFESAQAQLKENMSPEGMDQYVASMEKYADKIPGLSDAINAYKTEGASAFSGVQDAATNSFAEMKKQADKLYISLNKDNAEFYKTFLADNKNMTKLAEIEYDVRASDFKTYAEYETALDNAKKRGKIRNLNEEQRKAILTHENIENSYWNSATGQLEASNSLSQGMQQGSNAAGQTAVGAYTRMRQSGVSVADSIRYAFWVMVDKVSGGWANMVNSLVDALNSGLKAVGGFVNSAIEMFNKMMPGTKLDIDYRADWGNIEHISGTNYASESAEKIADKYKDDNYDWTVKDPSNVDIKNPGNKKPPGFTDTDDNKGPGDGPGTSKPDKGGDSGSDSSKEEKEVEDLEWEEDIYHDINIQLEQKQQLLDKLQKQQDKLYGKELLDNLAKQKKALQEQQALLEKKLEMQKKDLEQQKQDLSKQGVKFNVDGTIANYNQLLKQKLAYVNSLSGEAKEAAKEEFEALSEMMKKYEETSMNQILATENAIQDAIDAQREIFIQEFEYTIKIQLELADDFDKALDFQKQFNDSFEDGSENYQRTMDQLGNKVGEMNALQEQIKKTIADTSLTDKERMEMLDDLTEKLKKATLESKKLSEELTKIYKETLKEGLDMLKEHVDEYKKLNDEVNHIQQMMKLLGKEGDFSAMDSIYTTKYNNLQGQIDVYLQEKSVLEEERKRLEEAGLVGTEEWKAVSKAINDTQKELDKLTQDSVKVLQDQFKNTVNSIMDDLDKTLSGGVGLDKLKKDHDALKKERKDYLDIEQKITDVGKLQSKINNAMSSTTDPKQLAALQKFKDTELAQLKDKDKLTKYDVDRANLMYDITMKQMALEEQKNAKNMMKLVRDASGNWVYEFVEDTEAVRKAEEDLGKDLEKLQEMDKNRFQSVQDEMLQMKINYEKEVRGIIEKQMKGEYKSDEEFKKALTEANTTFTNSMKLKNEELVTAQSNGVTSSLATMLEAYRQSGTELGIMAPAQEKVMKQLAQAIGGDFTKLNELMTTLNSGNEAGFSKMAKDMGIDAGLLKTTLTTASGDIKKDWGGDLTTMVADTSKLDTGTTTAVNNIVGAWKKYKTDVEKVTKKTGNDYDSLKNRVQGIGTSTNDLNKKTSSLIKTFKKEIEQINKVVVANKNLKKSYEDQTKAIAKNIAKLDDYIKKQKEAATGVKKPEGSEKPNSGSSKPNGGSSSSKPTPPKPTPPPPPPKPPAPPKPKPPKKGSQVKVKNSGAGAWYTSGNDRPVPDWNRQARAAGVPWDSPMWSVNANNGKMALSKTNNIYGAIAWVKESDLVGLRSGGYTGKFNNPQEGKIAMLHEKELVLNKEDTKNILSAVKSVRGGEPGLEFLFKSTAKQATDRIVGAINRLGSTIRTSNAEVPVASLDKKQDLKQTVSINADFNGVKNALEIEKAFNSLAIQASQYAMKKR